VPEVGVRCFWLATHPSDFCYEWQGKSDT